MVLEHLHFTVLCFRLTMNYVTMVAMHLQSLPRCVSDAVMYVTCVAIYDRRFAGILEVYVRET